MSKVDTSVYEIAGPYSRHVRAFAIIESGEDDSKVGDGGQARGLLQMHPATFERYYHLAGELVADTWAEAEIRACAAYLRMYGVRFAAEEALPLIVMAWNLGEHAVFGKGERNPEYYARWRAAFNSLASQSSV